MGELGNLALCLAWFSSLCGILFGIFSGLRSNEKANSFACNSVILTSVFSLAAITTLAVQFLTNDYSSQYVWRYSNVDMQWIYKISAIWGGMDGSMLLWACILSFSSALVAIRIRRVPIKMQPWLLAILSSSSQFFLLVTTFLTNPFRYLQSPYIPIDGNGLNPLLQNTLMAIHPPMLYLGFTTLAIPFAFCMSALIAKDFSGPWIMLTRRWLLIAWAFLTTGIVLGGMWAYVELGWGGFWAWDPVENASFLPWLTATAFLHSVMVQERKGMLKTWNVYLVSLTYGLTVFGTFLTRSGIVQSVHAFASTDIGWVFLVYLSLILILTVYLTWIRKEELKPENIIESIFSREAAFLVNNLILLSICFATLWGVMFPVLSEAITGSKQAVAIPYFNAVNVPLFLLLLFVMSFGPLIAWRKANLKSLKKTFLLPVIASLIMGLILIWAGVESFFATLSYSLCFLVSLCILGEVHRSSKVQDSDLAYPLKVTRALKRQRTKFGGHLVHLGVVIAVIGITASMAHKIEEEFSLAEGQSYEVGRYKLSLESINTTRRANHDALIVDLEAFDKNTNKHIAHLRPELRRYTRNQESTTEVALHTSLKDDLYLVIAGLDDTGTRAALKVFVNPLQIWLWIGVLIIIVGTFIVLLPKKSTND
ncbi:MAG: heme lyase CcmF/NrfE family subunit [Bdellovibrionales bacterium]|nr:heme lyase CcmF/NrfE family subunit [Bdellovibrionales bacterium]